ncbi:hypothetical protein HZB78_02120 [Candidatus Collierbacteria bacterium]|nr:hypothetical protein [Candidatus Collierbacteria bacterium]
MSFFEQFKNDLVLRRAVSKLDLSAGMTDAPSLTAFDDTDPRLTAYLSGLRRVQEDIKKVAGSPEQVFLGDINTGRQTDFLLLVGQGNDDRKIPPRQFFGIEFPPVSMIDPEIAVQHLTELAAANLGVAAGDQKPLADQAIKGLKKNGGVLSEIEVNPDWKLSIWINNYGKTVTAGLLPIEKPEYSKHWVERQTGLVKQSIRPEALGKRVMTAAKEKYCLTETEVMRVDKIDFGGFLSGAVELAEGQGYKELTPEEIGTKDEDTLGSLSVGAKIYRHAGSKPEETEVRLGIKDTWLRKDVEFSAIPSPALRDKIKGEFKTKLEPTARRIIHQRIENVPPDKSFIVLDPDSFVDLALITTGQKLNIDEREQESEWLNAVIAGALIEELREYPQARPLADKLENMRSAAIDHTALPHDAQAIINLGWDPKRVNLILPKSWFEK